MTVQLPQLSGGLTLEAATGGEQVHRWQQRRRRVTTLRSDCGVVAENDLVKCYCLVLFPTGTTTDVSFGLFL